MLAADVRCGDLGSRWEGVCTMPLNTESQPRGRRVRMSTGAWVFAGLIGAAAVAPVSVYAASIAKTAIAGTNGTVASVTPQHQLLTTTIAPSQVVHIAVASYVTCKSVYKPPTGKAIVVTSVVYNYGSGSAGVENYGGLTTSNCLGNVYDQIDTVQAYETLEHTFPIGLPMPTIGLTNNGSGTIAVFITGYLVDASQVRASFVARTGAVVKSQLSAR